ncbi:CDGSH iron-sulfur domain-containing protein [Tropicimonas sp. TH_r6]|uniref:CDGSH iron-sulfur domain-containing protein n=1 Tax=Tropicimonas sp. TH_r6 TaxID=3082085 RepID=UPI002954C3B4|nr:CDGSH iron-sulfur domain-containing protein [Tropicimonas sp. TH_r6]MDV7141060.1 CDGSH iron-sulfur domain-containing protein [Tropicimonas sp. TH_r6]
MSEQDTSIEERENGPLIVKGGAMIARMDGEAVETRPVMALCRCGASANKPFCDGTHAKIGFESRGGTPAGRDRVIAYEGAEVTVHFNPRLCAHAAECGRLAAHIFSDQQRPWIQPDKGSVAEVEAVVRACPSGALQMSAPGEEAGQLFADRAGISVQKDGPYWVQGIAPPVPMDAEGGSAAKFVLCRCGQSGNKPFCDGSHRDAGWRDDAEES